MVIFFVCGRKVHLFWNGSVKVFAKSEEESDKIIQYMKSEGFFDFLDNV